MPAPKFSGTWSTSRALCVQYGGEHGAERYYYNRIYSEYIEQRLGGRVAFGYQFSPDLSGTIAYRGAKINISNPIDPLLPDLAAVTGRDLAMHGFQASLSHDKRDNAFLATEGHLIQLSFEEVLGSFQYPHAEIDLRKYFTLYERPDGSGRQVLSLGCRAGYTGDNTPIYERYYAGGFSTIRGFQFRGASPRRSPAGQSLVGNFEAGSADTLPDHGRRHARGSCLHTGTVEPRSMIGHRTACPVSGCGSSCRRWAYAIALDFAFPISWPGDQHEMFSFFMGFGGEKKGLGIGD